MTTSSLMDFPCDFDVKIIGTNQKNFVKNIIKVVKKHYPDWDASSIKQKESHNAPYLALTVNIHAISQKTLDALYQDLCACPGIKMVL